MEAHVLILLICATFIHGLNLPVLEEATCDNVNNDAICSIEGTNIKTFDGKHFNYAICDHILAQNECQNKWRIIERRRCQLGGCNKEIEIVQRSRVLTIKPNLAIEYNGFTYNVAQAHMIGSLEEEFRMFYNGRSIYFKSLLYGFWLIFDQQGNTKIGAPEELLNKVNGLCGKFNNIPEDDTMMPSGNVTTISHEFGNSWTVPNSNMRCPDLICSNEIRKDAFDICSNITKTSPLSICADVVDVDFCLNKCIKDYCYCEATSLNGDCKCEVIEKFMQHCQAEAPKLDLSLWRENNQCNQSCPSGLVYMDCNQRLCEPSCDNVYDPNACPIEKESCQSGCFCPEGTVKKGDACVNPDHCKDCVCSGWGDPHYTTFDGTAYDFQGRCTYVASAGTPINRNNSTPQNSNFYYTPQSYKVLVTNVPCGINSVSCTSAVTILYNTIGHYFDSTTNEYQNFTSTSQYKIERSPTVGKNLVTHVHNNEVINFPYNSNEATIESLQDHYVTIYIPGAQLEVTYYYYSWTFSVRVSSHLYASQNLTGLCGNCNKNRYDDFIRRDGSLTTSANDFGMSWLAKNGEELPYFDMYNDDSCQIISEEIRQCLPGYPLPAEQDPCLQIMDKTKFGQCHSLVNPDTYITACQFDLCHNDNRTNALCSAVHAYAKACQTKGLCLDWRSEEFCPYDCPAGKMYKACGTGCEVTCNNYWMYHDNRSICAVEPNEGCFCPDNLVSKGNRCVEPFACKDCTCTGWGDPHYRNFEGSYFPFQGNCTYVATRDKLINGAVNHNFQIWVTNKASPSCGSQMTCPVGLLILYNNHTIHVHSDENNWRIVTEIDGQTMTEFPVQTQWLMIQSYWDHWRVSIYIPELELEAQLHRNSFTIRMSSLAFNDNTEGLCGTCNNNITDDFLTSNGDINNNYDQFGMSWIVKENLPPGLNYDKYCRVGPIGECEAGYPLPATESNPCQWIMDKDKFGQCHEVEDPQPYVDACEFDMCHSLERDAIKCNGAEAYAERCRSKGICVDWRSKDRCPFNCPLGTEYKSCGSGCVEDCDNYQMYRRNPNLCGLETIEGCYCPVGEVLKNGQCIMESECNATCEFDSFKCKLIDLPASSIGRTLSLIDPEHGNCSNKYPLPVFKMCHGFCGSKPFYDGDTNAVLAGDQCCEATSYNNVTIVMKCTDNTELTRNIRYPSSCECSGCQCANIGTTTTSKWTWDTTTTPETTTTDGGPNRGLERRTTQTATDIDTTSTEGQQIRNEHVSELMQSA